MEMWQFWSIAGILFLILEMFTPAMFFLNFALAAFVVAIFATIFTNLNILILIFVIISASFLIWLRPFLAKKTLKSQVTGVEAKYIGQSAKVIETVNEYSGAVSIYGERWNAVSDDKSEIPVGDEVKIIRNESLVLYVKKENK